MKPPRGNVKARVVGDWQAFEKAFEKDSFALCNTVICG